MTTLNDIARCCGKVTGHLLGRIGTVRVTSGMGQSECVLCARRDPNNKPDGQTPRIDPPAFIGGKCPERIDFSTLINEGTSERG